MPENELRPGELNSELTPLSADPLILESWINESGRSLEDVAQLLALLVEDPDEGLPHAHDPGAFQAMVERQWSYAWDRMGEPEGDLWEAAEAAQDELDDIEFGRFD